MTLIEYVTALEVRVDFLKEKIEKDKKFCEGMEGVLLDEVSEFDQNLLKVHE
jgi:hypothetical protein